MKLFRVLLCIFCIAFITASVFGQKDTCAVLTGSPLNPDSYRTVKKILEKDLDCYVLEISLESDEIATVDLTNVKFLYWVIAIDVERNTPALTTSLFGNGRVFLSVSHPERSFIPGTWKFVRMAAEWCLGRSDPAINQAPIIETEIPFKGDRDQPLLFSAEGSTDPDGYPIGFIWDFGDGSDLMYRPVETHSFKEKDSYTVSLTVTDGKETTTFTEQVIIGAGS